MDLNKLVNSDVSAQEVDTRHVAYPSPGENHAAGQYRPSSELRQNAPNNTAYYQGQPTYGNGSIAPSPPVIMMPSPNKYGQQPQHHNYQQSPVNLSPYQTNQASPYGTVNGHFSRPTSHGQDRSPITPIQGTQPAVSPSSSQHSYTSNHQSPMPTIQYGLHPPSARTTSGVSGQMRQPEPQYYEAQPLGPPPPQRRSADHATVSPAMDHYTKNERRQSESVSPKTMPRADIPYGSNLTSMNDEVTMTAPQHVNFQAPRAAATNNSSVTPERPQLRRSQTMELSNLLTPVTETASDISITNMTSATHSAATTTEPVAQQAYQDHVDTKKRALEDATAESPAAKKMKSSKPRKYHEKPQWAVYSSRNRKAGAGDLTYIGGTIIADQQGHVSKKEHIKPHKERTNGASAVASTPAAQTANLEKPWQDNLPFDTDLIKAREVLGPWEKTFVWNTPLPDMLRTLQEWFYQHIQQYASVVEEAGGVLEIEAKLGRLMDNSRQARAELPIASMAIIRPSGLRDYRFESALTPDDFKKVNSFLNNATAKSIQPGRQPIRHARVLEEDSFDDLSQTGRAQIPRLLQQAMPPGRTMRLRTTTDIKSGTVTARIVKISLADLHIYNPQGYDCRISINAEVNMMRDGLQLNDLIAAPKADAAPQPSRRKDRMTYKHLAYEIDITSVSVHGQGQSQATFEMELEVDAQVLSKQVQLIVEQKPHAFGDVVSGFLDNATYLMRLA